MKNLKKIIGMFSVLSFVGINASIASTGIVNTPAARVREKASTDSEIIKNIYEDDKVEIVGEEGEWYKVKIDGKTGYVSKSLIKSSEAETKTKKEDNNNTTNNTNTTNSTTEKNSVKVEKEENTANENTKTETENKTNSETETSNNVLNSTEAEQPENAGSKNVISKDTTLKLLPNFGSNDLRFLDINTEVKIEKELGKWAKVSLSDSSIGWVLKSNISDQAVEVPKQEENTNTTTEETNTVADKKEENTVSNEVQVEAKNIKGKIKVETANVRAKASTDSEVIGKLDEGAEVTIVEESGDWYKITNSKIKSGYVSKSLVKVSSDVSSRGDADVREEPVAETPSVETTPSVSENSGSVVQTAKQYLGYSYVSGGKNPESGFDCSGFTGYIYKQYGVTLGATAASQDGAGQAVDRANLQPGDLILFQDEGRTKIGHTGIYIGNNEFIHAANPQRGVVIDNLSTNSYYNERYVSARRVVE